MKYSFQAIKVVCDTCNEISVFVQEKKIDDTVNSQAVSSGWTLHHDGKCTCIKCKDEKKIEYFNKYREENKEIMNHKHREYAKKNRPIMNAINKRWHDKNPDKQKEYDKKRKSPKL